MISFIFTGIYLQGRFNEHGDIKEKFKMISFNKID